MGVKTRAILLLYTVFSLCNLSNGNVNENVLTKTSRIVSHGSRVGDVSDFHHFVVGSDLSETGEPCDAEPSANAEPGRYQPNWASLETRPIPAWYDQAKFGIFIHWGTFSVPSFGSALFWDYWKHGVPQYVNFMKKNYPPDFTYADFAAQFKAEFYDPDKWADLFKAAGARYVVFVSKHNEGFCNWETKYSFNWNSKEVGPKRDLLGDLANSIRNRTNIRFGIYHSSSEYENPLFMNDKANNFTTREYAEGKSLPEWYELVNKYRPDVVWADGSGGGPDTYWRHPEFLAWLYNDSPVKDHVVINDRWYQGCLCHHGGFFTCGDRYNPGVLQKRKWENAMTIDGKAWTYRREASLSDFLSPEKLVATLVETVSCGGNLLMNVGPTHDGRITPIFEERLRQIGSWLAVNGEAIYETNPWSHQNDTKTPSVWYTSKKGVKGTVVYAITLTWPSDNLLYLGAPITTSATQVTMLGFSGNLKWKAGQSAGLTVAIPAIPFNKMPCQYAWVFKLKNLL